MKVNDVVHFRWQITMQNSFNKLWAVEIHAGEIQDADIADDCVIRIQGLPWQVCLMVAYLSNQGRI